MDTDSFDIQPPAASGPRTDTIGSLLGEHMAGSAVPSTGTLPAGDIAASFPGTLASSLSGGKPIAAPATGSELIAGYTIQHSIGSGGFGEVFAATAPGGIQKAIKVVYGRLEESRAERELKSLQRVKEVRHPFVISIERIEIADDRLVIVTELADGSLRDAYDEARQQKKPGVDRDRLLAYLADAADALDYLYEKHGLQHLDIKPENLLLLGDHCKVADFGLLKDLRDKQMSLMGGITPLYAPPEVLEGRPDHRSDQYALAIVYQEMLTGVLPFNGRTPGQLATQHLHSEPSLTSLPSADRYAIGRALAKSPEKRFASCKELVETLRNPPQAALAKSPSVQRSVQSATERRVRRNQTASTNSPLLTPVDRTPEVRQPLDIDTAAPVRPTIVIGLGGLGGEAVRYLRRDLVRQFGSADLASIQLLAIDSDASLIEQLRTGLEADDADTLQPHELLHIPLRTASEYRDRKDSYLSWLSRRWLYNVPRTLTTGGMRPLGRLAFVDHAAAVRRRVSELITDVLREDAPSVSASVAGVPFAETPPQVLLIGAAGGGQSSGAMIDLAYATAQLLRDAGIEAMPHALLLDARPASAEHRDLATANQTALLGELLHFASGESYPGDGTGRPDGFAPSGKQPLASVSLVDCNGDAKSEQRTRPAEIAATYLMQNILGSSGQFLAHARAADSSGQPTLRSVGLLPLDASRHAADSEADALAHQVLTRWVDSCRLSQNSGGLLDDTANVPAENATLAELLETLQLTGEPAAADCEAIETALADCGQLVSHVEAGAQHVPRSKAFEVVGKAVAMTDSALECVRTMRENTTARLARASEGRVAALRRRMFQVCEQGGCTVDDIRRRMFATAARLTDLLKNSQQRAQQCRSRCDQIERGDAAITADLLGETIRTRLQAQVACLEADALQSLIAAALEPGRLFDAAIPALQRASEAITLDPQFAQPVEGKRLDEIERRVAEAVTDALGPYWLMRLSDGDIAASLLQAARRGTQNALRERSLDSLLGTDAIDAARAPYEALAGSVRWLAVGPTQRAVDVFAASVKTETGVPPTTVQSIGLDTVLCCEAGDLPISNVTTALVGNRLDLLQTADQLKSRSDINWCW